VTSSHHGQKEHDKTGSVDVNILFVGNDASCNTIKLANDDAKSGFYDVTLGLEEKVHVYCDMDTLAPDGTKGGWTLFLSYFSNDQGGESNHNMHTARDANDPFEFYPGKDGKEFDLEHRSSKDNNFKLPIKNLKGGKDTFIALTGAGNNCEGVVAPHDNNLVFPKVIKFVDTGRLNNWVQHNNVKEDGSQKFCWGMHHSLTNRKFIHRSWNMQNGNKAAYSAETNSWECSVLAVWVLGFVLHEELP
jgi:hypothetical protein